jgi:methylmalonyl-CoA epimerase
MTKPVLDHIGIAVRDLSSALSFYQDGLGLEVEPVEEIESEQVRVRFVPAGEASLELLEGTEPSSPITRFVGKRGPGLHHITIRVDDIHAALARLKALGIPLIDEHPRPGAPGSLVAFVHPSGGHGVLVELKQGLTGGEPQAKGSAVPTGAVARFSVGDLEVISLYDGLFRLDGGSMFGVVPRPLWETKTRPDARNRILLAMRPLVVRGTRTMLVDAGLGDKEDEKFRDIYGVDRARHLDHALAEAGLTPADIDLVVATHLHFDHAGGFTMRDDQGRIRPRFPRARYVVRRGEWDDAMHPHERNRASYLRDNFAPLAEAGVLELVDRDQTIMPGVRVVRTGGHTAHHQMVLLESGGRHAAFVADLIPTVAHVSPAWIMGYDLFPVETLAAKKAFLREAVERETMVFFEHDPVVQVGRIVEDRGKFAVNPWGQDGDRRRSA